VSCVIDAVLKLTYFEFEAFIFSPAGGSFLFFDVKNYKMKNKNHRK